MLRKRHSTSVLRFVALPAIALFACVPAMADLSVLSFTYNGLAATFESTGETTGTFVAVHTADLDGQFTTGDVRRLDPLHAGQAMFSWFDSDVYRFATVNLTLDLTDIDQGTQTANATGTIVLTDIHGDEIESEWVSGTWSLDPGGIAHFDGTASQVQFEGEWFDGIPFPGFDGFDMDFSMFDQVLGSVVDLTGLPSGGFFDTNWPGAISSNIESQMIPAPGAALLGVIGLVLISRIKRRL